MKWALSSAEAPPGYPYKIAIIKKNKKRAGDDGKREKAGKSVPRALSFSFSPASPKHKKASADERVKWVFLSVAETIVGSLDLLCYVI